MQINNNIASHLTDSYAEIIWDMAVAAAEVEGVVEISNGQIGEEGEYGGTRGGLYFRGSQAERAAKYFVKRAERHLVEYPRAFNALRSAVEIDGGWVVQTGYAGGYE